MIHVIKIYKFKFCCFRDFIFHAFLSSVKANRVFDILLDGYEYDTVCFVSELWVSF